MHDNGTMLIHVYVHKIMTEREYLQVTLVNVSGHVSTLATTPIEMVSYCEANATVF